MSKAAKYLAAANSVLVALSQVPFIQAFVSAHPAIAIAVAGVTNILHLFVDAAPKA